MMRVLSFNCEGERPQLAQIEKSLRFTVFPSMLNYFFLRYSLLEELFMKIFFYLFSGSRVCCRAVDDWLGGGCSREWRNRMEQQSAPSESTASEAALDTRNTNAVPPTQPTSSNPNSNSNASSTTSSTTTTSSSSNTNTNTNAQPSAQSSTNVDSPHTQTSTMVDLLDISQLRALIDTPAAGLTSHRCPMVRYVFHFMYFHCFQRCCVRFQSYPFSYEFIFSFCVSMLTNVNDVAASQHVPVDDVLTNRIQELEAENRELQDKRMFRLAAFVCVSLGRISGSL
jgi:hypothetical protein